MDTAKHLARSQDISTKVALVFQKRAKLAGERLAERVKQAVGGLTVLKAAEQYQVTAACQHSVAGNREQAGRVPVLIRTRLVGHTTLPP